MRSVCIDYERPKSLIALSNFPEEHNHLRCEFIVLLLVSGYVRGAGMERVVENSSDSICNKLKILWSM